MADRRDVAELISDGQECDVSSAVALPSFLVSPAPVLAPNMCGLFRRRQYLGTDTRPHVLCLRVNHLCSEWVHIRSLGGAP
jgi:hypothetical protein